VANGDTDPDAARDRDHRCLKSSRTCCRASVSTSRSTRTRQPRPSSISTIPALARCAGGEDGGCGAHVNAGAAVEVISTGTRADTASPLNPAVARQAAPREQLARRQPIASRSHRHQSWPAIALGKNATRPKAVLSRVRDSHRMAETSGSGRRSRVWPEGRKPGTSCPQNQWR
jgi:hypothetical protein